jgi:hypothetical protein
MHKVDVFIASRKCKFAAIEKSSLVRIPEIGKEARKVTENLNDNNVSADTKRTFKKKVGISFKTCSSAYPGCLR